MWNSSKENHLFYLNIYELTKMQITKPSTTLVGLKCRLDLQEEAAKKLMCSLDIPQETIMMTRNRACHLNNGTPLRQTRLASTHLFSLPFSFTGHIFFSSLTRGAADSCSLKAHKWHLLVPCTYVIKFKMIQ